MKKQIIFLLLGTALQAPLIHSMNTGWNTDLELTGFDDLLDDPEVAAARAAMDGLTFFAEAAPAPTSPASNKTSPRQTESTSPATCEDSIAAQVEQNPANIAKVASPAERARRHQKEVELAKKRADAQEVARLAAEEMQARKDQKKAARQQSDTQKRINDEKRRQQAIVNAAITHEALIKIISEGTTKQLKKYLSQQATQDLVAADIMATPETETLILRAIQVGNFDMVRELLAHKPGYTLHRNEIIALFARGKDARGNPVQATKDFVLELFTDSKLDDEGERNARLNKFLPPLATTSKAVKATASATPERNTLKQRLRNACNQPSSTLDVFSTPISLASTKPQPKAKIVKTGPMVALETIETSDPESLAKIYSLLEAGQSITAEDLPLFYFVHKEGEQNTIRTPYLDATYLAIGSQSLVSFESLLSAVHDLISAPCLQPIIYGTVALSIEAHIMAFIYFKVVLGGLMAQYHRPTIMLFFKLLFNHPLYTKLKELAPYKVIFHAFAQQFFFNDKAMTIIPELEALFARSAQEGVIDNRLAIAQLLIEQGAFVTPRAIILAKAHGTLEMIECLSKNFHAPHK
jgi:predicted secreted protein